jgi:hypothetical protein
MSAIICSLPKSIANIHNKQTILLQKNNYTSRVYSRCIGDKSCWKPLKGGRLLRRRVLTDWQVTLSSQVQCTCWV